MQKRAKEKSKKNLTASGFFWLDQILVALNGLVLIGLDDPLSVYN